MMASYRSPTRENKKANTEKRKVTKRDGIVPQITTNKDKETRPQTSLLEFDESNASNALSEWLADCVDSFTAGVVNLEDEYKDLPIKPEDFDFFGEVPSIFKDLVEMFSFSATETAKYSVEEFEATKHHTTRTFDSVKRENIVLQETELFWLLDLPDTNVEDETNENKSVTSQNMFYNEYMDRKYANHALCDTVGIQTRGTICKSVHVQTHSVSTQDKNTMAMNWILFDAYNFNNQNVAAQQEINTLVDVPLCTSRNLENGLFFMERAISWNIYRPQLVSVKGCTRNTSGTECITKMDLQFKTSEAANLRVTCLAWETKDPNIFAVGYSFQSDSKRSGGLVQCWSLKNCCHPERTFRTPTGVTGVSFSGASPLLLAVALDDGQIFVLDAHTKLCRVVKSNMTCNNRSFATIWHVAWTWIQDVGGDKAEILVSSSEDGRVLQWNSTRSNVMECRSLARVQLSNVVGETVLMPNAFACCVAFSPNLANVYLVGTDEGHIYKYSMDSSEHYLNAFLYHTGVVYKIEWSPFDPSVFISCGVDGTIAVWCDEEIHPRLVFQSTLCRGVVDVVWCPKSATSFVAVTDISIEVWDMNYSLWQPVAFYESDPGIYFTCVAIVRRTNNILVGCTNGEIESFVLHCGENEETALFDIMNDPPGKVHWLPVSETQF